MKYLVILFVIAQFSRAKSENDFNKFQLEPTSSEESSESGESGVSKSSEEGPISAVKLSVSGNFLQPPYCGISNATRTRINGGKIATQRQFPWMVALGYIMPNDPLVLWGCGGALITKKHVLTVAHCIQPLEKYLKLVRLGALDILNNDTSKYYNPGQDIVIEKKIVHEKYNRRNLMIHDIGIVTLTRQIIAPMVWPICLPASRTLSRESYEGKSVTVAGWGIKYKNGPRNPLLEFVSFKVYSKKMCMKHFSLTSSHNVMCAADPQWKQTVCNGDSGGPLMYKVAKKVTIYYVIGLASFVSTCIGTPGKMTGFTEIVPYLDWIRNQIFKK